MAEKLVDVLRENPNMKCRGMRHELQKFGVSPPYMQLYRAKKIAMLGIEGNHETSFGMLTKCVEMGLVECITEMVPHAINRKCARHIYANLRQIQPGVMVKKLFWGAARAYNAPDFNSAMLALRNHKRAAYDWLMNIEIPCKHAALAIEHKRDNIELYTDPSFHKSMYMKAYSQKIHAIPNPTFWPSLNVYPESILPPPIKRMPGRPKKHRRREVGEGSRVRKPSALKCSKCGHTGHNKRTCGGPPVHKRRGKGRIAAQQVEFDENVPLKEAVRAVKRQKRNVQVNEILLGSQEGPPLTQQSQGEANAQDGGISTLANMDPYSMQIEVDAATAAFFEDAQCLYITCMN
ncbi:UNVERIFIED_CONTAM: hypothetical protein Slati_3955300 [Sesamum latifolium]|uniref:CCHC-type domain-containing protein n=1 Tax=Sesamum latifolium TaxID=2727402 RepID=A0AAW2TPP6_9LAMI